METMLILLLLLPLCSAAPLGGDKPGIYDAVEELRKRIDTIEAYLKENSNGRDGRDLNVDELDILNNIAPAIGILKSCGKDGDDDGTCNAAQIQNVSEDIGLTFEKIREGKSVGNLLQEHFNRLKMEIDAAIEMAEEEITDELAGMDGIEVPKFVDGTCYADDHYRFLLPDRILYSATNSPDECIETCASRGYSYAGVQYAHECFCGNQEPPASRIRESSQCRMKCPGDSRFFCGGDWRMNIYTVIKSGTCDASNWPDLDHGLTCGDCKALIDGMKSKYITCDNYCHSIGRSCSGAWEESGDSCNVKSEETCAHRFTYTSDAICKCGPILSGTCDASNWPDLDHGLTCGDCKALIDGMKSKYITCDNYCGSIGRSCSGAWEESSDSCEVKSTETCEHRFTYTSDAICQCGKLDLSGCPASHFSCLSGECILQKGRCNGLKDCSDGSDERTCQDYVCPADHFKCSPSGKCISGDWICDGEEDCNDGSDEYHCEDYVCPADRFKCSSGGECIYGELRCDGKEDCRDGSDEYHCEDRTTTAAPTTTTMTTTTTAAPTTTTMTTTTTAAPTTTPVTTTTSAATTMVASTTAGFCSDVSCKVIVMDGTTNSVVENAAVLFIFMADGIPSAEVFTDSNGENFIPIYKNGEYKVKVSRDDYIDFETTFTMDCDLSQCDLCAKTVLVSLSPAIQQGEARVIMNWAENPYDLDLHVLQVHTTSDETCHIYYSGNCPGITLDVDNMGGGLNGAETITFEKESQSSDFVYMVYVHEFGNDYYYYDDDHDYSQLGESEARLNIVSTSGTSTEKMDNIGYSNENYWLAGCFRFNEIMELEWRSKNYFVSEDPLVQSRNLCIDFDGV